MVFSITLVFYLIQRPKLRTIFLFAIKLQVLSLTFATVKPLKHITAMKKYISEILSFVLLALGIWLRSHATDLFPFQGAELLYFLIAFLPVGVPVVKEAWECICEKSSSTSLP